MKLKDLISRKKTDKRPFIKMNGETDVAVIEESMIKGHDLIGVTGRDGGIDGYVDTEKLIFVIECLHVLQDPSLMDAFDEGIICVSTNGRIFFINDAYSKIIGVAKERILGQYIQDIEPGAELIKVMETRKPITKDYVHIKSVNKNVSVKMRPIYYKKQFAGACSVFTDITEVTELDREVKRITDVASRYDDEIRAIQAEKNMAIIGADPVFKKAIERAKIAGQTDATVMITGENGAGKEIFAKLIYSCSLRRDRPFITVNCAAIPENLIESELFGYEKGAFTGADRNGKTGKFEMADTGTIFLDEIGDMPLQMQAKLLRVLENGEIEKIGRTSNIPVDVRVIAATNQDLEKLVATRMFRQDLYYRLKVMTVHVPPLRERGHDVMLLASYFADTFNKKYNKHFVITKGTEQYIKRNSWRGNVRELQNFIEEEVILSGMEDAGNRYADASPGEYNDALSGVRGIDSGSFEERMKASERYILESTLSRNSGNREKTIEELKMNRRTFYRKMAEMRKTE